MLIYQSRRCSAHLPIKALQCSFTNQGTAVLIYQSSPLIVLPVEELHIKVRGIWSGRGVHKLTESLEMWIATYVRPCLDCEPGSSIQDKHLQGLLDFLVSDASRPQHEIELVKAIVTGRVARHQAISRIENPCDWLCSLHCFFFTCSFYLSSLF